MNIGNVIRKFRKAKGVTQENLAEYLSVSPQAVSKWENGLAYPDITVLPSLASYFDVTPNDLLEYDKSRIDAEVEALVTKAGPLYNEPKKYEEFMRQALEKYPNNEVLLDCLIGVLGEEKRAEKIEIAQKLVQYTDDDCIKYDAIRTLAETYSANGDFGMAEHWLEQLPEIYFTKLELEAMLLRGDKAEHATRCQTAVSYDIFMEMLSKLAENNPSIRELGRRILICMEQADFLSSDFRKGVAEQFEQGKYRFMD